MLTRLIARVPKRQFSKYIEENYGKNAHRLANRPGIEVAPLEVFAYSLGAFLFITDCIRDQDNHRREYIANGSPVAVWNERLWIQPEGHTPDNWKQAMI